MISKIFPYNSFLHNCLYIFDSPDVEILVSAGVRDHDPVLIVSDFEFQAQQRPGKTRNCFHGVLSFYPGEQPEKETMIEIAGKYLNALGIVDTQYIIALHKDRPHLHLHILANMVNNEGRSITDSWLYLKGKKAAQQLTDEYRLRPAVGKDLSLTHLEKMNGLEADRYRIYIAVSELLDSCRSMAELKAGLLKKGIETRIKISEDTGEPLGIIFKTGSNCFKGSKVDRQFSLANLDRRFRYPEEGSLLQTQPS